MSQKIRPYVSVTGLVTEREVDQTLESCARVHFNGCDYHVPMLGFLVTEKTLHGKSTESKRYPPVQRLPALVRRVQDHTVTSLHYFTRNEAALAEQVEFLFASVYELGCRTLQLNCKNPPVRQVERIREIFPELSLIFKLQKELIGAGREVVEQALQPYVEFMDYLCLDPSNGKGIEGDEKAIVATHHIIRNLHHDLRMVVVGGFTAENVGGRVRRILQKTNDRGISLDAESGLRDKISDAWHDDLLNPDKVTRYLKSITDALRKNLVEKQE